MTVTELIDMWEKHDYGEITKETYSVKLNIEDAAKIHALREMYPRRNVEQIISDLLSAALTELETRLPYVEGKNIAAYDELGDPIFADAGPTPAFLDLTQKHMQKLKQEKRN